MATDSTSGNGSFALLDTRGLPHALADHAGHPVLAGFFKTTCPTCMMTFPYLERLHRAYGRAGLAVWGVSQDTLDDSLAFAADHNLTFPILLDTTWDVSNMYGIQYVPTLYLFDAQGTLKYSGISFCKDDLNEIGRLIAEDMKVEPIVVAPADDGKPLFRPG